MLRRPHGGRTRLSEGPFDHGLQRHAIRGSVQSAADHIANSARSNRRAEQSLVAANDVGPFGHRPLPPPRARARGSRLHSEHREVAPSYGVELTQELANPLARF